MGFIELLTLVFIVLKLINAIEWSWFMVLLPEIIAFSIYIPVLLLAIFGTTSSPRRSKK